MKVILTREVDNLGLAGDVVNVADGYGRNFLLPRGMAILATPGAMKEAEALTRSRRAKEAKTLDQAQEYKAAIEDRTLVVKARVDERGHLYGSVGVGDVHRVLKERGHQIEKKRIALRGTIKELGTYEIDVQVHPQVMATLTLEVLDEEGKVIAGQVPEPPAPLPGEMAEAAEAAEAEAASAPDAIVEAALEAAEELEAAEAEAEADAAEADAAEDGDGAAEETVDA